jgi:hypothetical protein
LWQDSSFFQDSFFAPDNRLDASLTGDLPPYDPARIERASALPDVDLSDTEPPRRDDGEDDADERGYRGTGTHN